MSMKTHNSRRQVLRHLAAAGTALLLFPKAAWARYWTPQRGTAERKALMDAARPAMSREIGGPIEFVVHTLRTDGDWAYLFAQPQRPGGTPIDWRQTPFAQDWADGFFDEGVMILYRLDGQRWTVVDYFIGPTDVPWYAWIDQYGLPEALFTP
jgi:hypothetical protein